MHYACYFQGRDNITGICPEFEGSGFEFLLPHSRGGELSKKGSMPRGTDPESLSFRCEREVYFSRFTPGPDDANVHSAHVKPGPDPK